MFRKDVNENEAVAAMVIGLKASFEANLPRMNVQPDVLNALVCGALAALKTAGFKIVRST